MPHRAHEVWACACCGLSSAAVPPPLVKPNAEELADAEGSVRFVSGGGVSSPTASGRVRPEAGLAVADEGAAAPTPAAPGAEAVQAAGRQLEGLNPCSGKHGVGPLAPGKPAATRVADGPELPELKPPP